MKLIIVGLLCVSSFALANKEIVDRVVAIVNSEPILQSDLQDLAQRMKKDGGIDETLMLGETTEKLKSNTQEQLEFLIREKLVESEVKKLNLSISEDRLNSEINTMAKRNNVTKAELESQIRKQGFSMTEYKKILKSKIERQSFFETEVISKLRITDEDAYSEFRAKFPKYKPSVNEFSISQIYFNPRKGSSEEALKRAEEILSKINAGENFESLANKFNEDPRANKDGYLGSFKSGEFIPEIENEIVSLEAGKTSRIIKTKMGYHIVKVLDKKITRDPQFLKVKEQIKAMLVEKNFKRQLKNWFESKKQDAYIKINL